MSTPLLPITPPAPRVHAKDLPVWPLLFALYRNNLAIFPDATFEALISRRTVLGVDSLMVSDPEGVRHVLATAAANYTRHVAAFRIFRPLGGQGVFLAQGAEWRRQRHTLAPSFTPAAVDVLLPHFAQSAVDLVKRLEPTSRVNLSAAYQDAALEAVLRALFSLPDSNRRGRLAAMVRQYLSGAGRPTILDGFARKEGGLSVTAVKRRRFQRAWFAAVDQVIAERRQTAAPERTRDLLDLLLASRDPESGDAMSNAELRDQSATMLFAGFETTSRLLFWTTYLLTLDREGQGRIRSEVTAFPPERVTSLGDLLNWPRLRHTLLEALRLYPPVPHITRVALGPDRVLGEEIAAGTQVWISPWVMHRHRKFWEYPTAFMPDRFAGKPSSWTNGGSFLPFGAGPRICLGAAFAFAEAQIALATLLTRFTVTLDDARPVLPIATVTTAPSIEPLFRLERC